MINSSNNLFGKREKNNNSTKVEFNFLLNKAKDGLIVTGIKNSSIVEEQVVIPSKAQFYGKVYPVTEIGKNAFCQNKMTSVVIPNCVIFIDECAFAQCECLVSVIIPDGVKSIRNNAFASCKKLSEVIIGKSVLHIKDSVFYNCSSLKRIAIPNNVKTIGSHAFENTSLTNITIPDSVTTIGNYAFFHCRELIEVEVGSSLERIAESAFYGCPILNKRSIEKIKNTIELCNLKRSVIPEVLNNAFQTNGVIPETVLEAVCHVQYLTQYGKQIDYSAESSVLNEYFFPSMVEFDMMDQVEVCSLTMRYKKEDYLETFVLMLAGKEELLDVLLWMRNYLFAGKMKGKHELSTWFRGKKQEELADYVAGDTVNINDFRYPLRVSKVVVSSKDIEKTVSGFSDLYNERGYEISKRGYRVPTFEEWIHFANSIEGQSILDKQYNGKDAYEVCMVDAKTILHVNVKSHKLAVLDYEYRRTHPGPLREGYYRYVLSPIAEKDLFPEGFVNKEAARLLGEAEAEYEEYLERREPWDC